MVKRCSRFGQMALEFTMTYGWAMLLILVSFSGLAYLGVFEGDTYIQPYCSLDGSLACSDFFMTMRSTDEFILDMNLVNNLDERANISSVRLQAVDGTSFCLSSKITDLNDDDTNFVLAPKGGGDDIRFVFIDGVDCSFTDAQFNDALDSKTKYLLEVYYIPGSGTKQVVSTGSIIARTRFNDTAAPPPPPPPSHCLDGDFGPDFFNASYVSSNTGTDNDICDGFGVLTEYICDANNISQSVTHNCTLADQVCIDGLCYTPSNPCEDTDGGNYPEIHGETTDAYGTAYDVCDGIDIIYEYYCVGNLKYLERLNCPWGCDTTADECYLLPSVCIDTIDGGNVSDVFGKTSNGSITKGDFCENNAKLREYYCVGDDVVGEVIDCFDVGYDGCVDGACVGEAPPPPPPPCVDSDHGHNYTVAGNVTVGGIVDMDICRVDADRLIEFFCDGDVSTSEGVVCTGLGFPGGCVDGGCVEASTVVCPDGTTQIDGKCWTLGAAGKSCDETCVKYEGASCVAEDWNDDASCSVCSTFGGSGCTAGTYTYAPGIIAFSTSCFYRETVHQNCGASTPGIQRLCVCE